MEKLSMKVCKLDKTPICELLDNTPNKAKNISEKFAINEVTTLSFDLPLNYNGKWKNLSNETLIYFNEEYYNIKTVQFTHSKDGKLLLHVEAKHLSEILASQLISVEETTPRNIIDLLKIALMYDENGVSQTGWTIGDIKVDKVKLRGLEANEQSPFSIILSIVEKWDAIAIFDSKTMKVNVIPSKSTNHPSLDLRVSKNLKEVNITYDTSEICTRLYGYGGQDDDGNDLDFMSVNPTGLPYVDNFDYFISKGYTLDYIKQNPQMFVRTNIYREESIYDPQDLYDNTLVELEKVSQPKVEVSIEALNTKQIKANNIVNVGLGDCVLVHDEDLGMSFVCNVISKEVDYENPHLLNVELVNSIQYRDIIAELFNSVNNVSSIVHSGNITGSTTMEDVENFLHLYYLTAEQIIADYATIENLRTNYLTSEQIKATYIDSESIASKYATITQLNAVEAQIKDLDVDVLNAKLAEIEELTADFADILELVATSAEIEELKANNVTIAGKLKATEANIDTIKATYVQVGSLEAYKATIENLNATNAEIETLKAKYIDALAIETDQAKITQLEAAIAKIETLEATLANVETLVSQTVITDNLEANKATIDNLDVNLANIDKAIIDIAQIEDLEAANAQIDNLNAQYIDAVQIDVDSLNAKSATIEQLLTYTLKSEFGEFKNLTVQELDAAHADIGSLDANVANINSVLAGNVGTGLLQTVHLTADNVVIDDAVIKSANIESIDTDVVTVGNDNITLSGSTQQFKDKDGNVRVQIGQDAQRNFTFIICDENGATIISGSGVTEKAIPNGLIKDKMVADDAGIQASKVNYIDKDGNKTLQTVITTEQGRINALIKETTIENENGTTTSLKDKYLDIDASVDGIKTSIVDVETDMETMKSNMAEIEATANGIIAQVSSIGGQNLFYYSSKDWLTKTTGEDYIFVGCYKEETDNDMEGKDVTLSIEFDKGNTTSGTFDVCYYNVDTPSTSDIVNLFTNIPLTEIVDGKYKKTFVYPTTTSIATNTDGSMPMFTMLIRVSNINGTFKVRKGMLQFGKMATEWQPTSDNVSESLAKVEIQSNKINWLVKSGTNETNFELTDRTATLVADNINLKGLVTFSGLSSDVNEQLEKVDNLEVGGRNYLLNSENEQHNSGASNAEFLKTTFDLAPFFDEHGLVEVTLSFEAYAEKAGTIRVYCQNGTSFKYSFIDTVDATTEWKRYDVTFTPGLYDESEKESYLAFYGIDGYGSGVVPHVRKVKLETGNIATDWTPAPEDKANQSLIDAWVSDAIVEGTTTINGGYIKTNTINSNHLIVDDIFASGSVVMNIIDARELNADMITSGTIKSNYIELYGLEVKHQTSGVTTFAVDNKGEVTIRGGVESYNYTSGSSGWSINPDGNAEFNDVTVRGDLINTDGGISSETGVTKTVRFWAGSSYEERESAPWIVYSDGSMVSTKGTFGGVFTGEIEIGNISIIDPSKTSGNDAIVTIQHGGNGIKRVQLRDTESSDFAQAIRITDNAYNQVISLGQDGYGLFNGGVTVGNSTKSSVLSNDSLTLNGSTIDGSVTGKLNITPTTLNIGTVSSKTNLNVYGSALLNDDVTFNGSIMIGNKLKITSKSNGVDIDFVE